MIVELFGLPASGKSTIARAWAREEDVVLVHSLSPSTLIVENVAFACRYPIRALRLYLWLSRAPRALRRSLFFNLYLVHNAKYMRARRLSLTGRIALIDQGHFQNLVSLWGKVPDDAALRTYLKLLPRPDLLVVIDAPQETRSARIARRAAPPRVEFGESESKRLLEMAEAVYARLPLLFEKVGIPRRMLSGVEGVPSLHAFLAEHIAYATIARMPTEKAHGVSIAHMCASFARAGSSVELVIPKRRNPITEDLYLYYGVPKTFSIKELAVPDFIGAGATFPVFFFLQRLLYESALQRTRPLPGVVYTREPELVNEFRHSHLVVLELHRVPRGLAGMMTARFARRAHLVVCNSRGTEKALRARGVRRTLVAPNGYDPALFSGAVPTRVALNLPDGMLALYAGSEGIGKGADIVRAAAHELQGDMHIALVGGKSAPAKGTLVEVGHVVPHALPGYLRSADILLLPNTGRDEESERYTSPIKLFEYLAAGKPIIASDLPSIREILTDEDAFLVPPGDAKALAEAIAKLASDPTRTAHLAGRSAALAERYTWDARASRILGKLSHG